MEVYKRGDSPYWYVDLVHPGTGARSRRSTGKTLKAEAQKAARAMFAQAEGEAADAVSGRLPITLQAALDAYVDNVAVEGKAAARLYRVLRDKLLGLRPPFTSRWHLDPSRQLHTLQPTDLEALKQARRAEGNGAQTIAHEIKLLRAATRYAAGLKQRVPELLTDGASKNPWRMPKLVSKTRYLSREEYDAVYAYLSPDRTIEGRARGTKAKLTYRLADGAAGPQVRRTQMQDAQDLLVALALTGCRWSEVAQLQWRQVDLEADTIMAYAGKTETERPVPMPGALKAVLTRRKATAKGSYVFPGKGGASRGPGSCQAILRALQACGLNSPELVAKHGRATVHSLRHTFASTALQGGADLSEVQETLGHTTLQMTRRYAHLCQKKTVARLNGIMDTAMGDAR